MTLVFGLHLSVVLIHRFNTSNFGGSGFSALPQRLLSAVPRFAKSVDRLRLVSSKSKTLSGTYHLDLVPYERLKLMLAGNGRGCDHDSPVKTRL